MFLNAGLAMATEIRAARSGGELFGARKSLRYVSGNPAVLQVGWGACCIQEHWLRELERLEFEAIDHGVARVVTLCVAPFLREIQEPSGMTVESTVKPKSIKCSLCNHAGSGDLLMIEWE